MNRERVARWGPPSLLLLLLLFAGFTYFFKVGEVPSASGDEGNWMSMGHRIFLGLPTQLGPDARFVTTAFARMIALAYRVGGITIGAARSVLGVSVLVGLVGIYAICARMRVRAMGLALCAMIATHPWTVWWSRSVVVPYAIALVLAVLGPIAWVVATSDYREDAPDRRSQWLKHLRLIGAGQLLVAILHFTPFGLLALFACGLWSLVARDGRRSIRTLGPWLALVAALVHSIPIVTGVTTVMNQARPAQRFVDFDQRWRNFARSIIDGFSGEQTLRDYVGDNAYMTLSPTPSRALVVLLLVGASAIALKNRKQTDGDLSESARALRSFAPLYLLVALVGFPLVLAPARDWWLATIDSERYFFALLAPGALLVATISLSYKRAGLALACVLAAYFAVGPNLRAARYFWTQGGPDHGYFTAHRGGGYRGYKVMAGPRSVTTAIYEMCRDAARGEGLTIGFNDYAFHPVRVLIRVKPDHNLNSVYMRDAALARGRRLCIPVWPEAMFASGHIPGSAVQQNRWMRNYVLNRMDESRRIAVWAQPNGAPLLEVYTGRVSEREAGHRPE
ncbi:MAG: hypothetical protein U0269_31320 [Polyangiales bacterium]